MSLQDPISDMLTRIRNAQKAKHTDVTMPYSTIKENISKVLKKEGFVSGYAVSGDIKKSLTITLKYEDISRRLPVIKNLKRVSRPGLRIYKKCADIPFVKERMGIVIVSTPLGIVSGKEARQNNVGGELLAIVE